MRKFILVLVLVMMFSLKVEAISEERGYIYIGDSRFVGLNQDVGLEDENIYVVAKVGQGYSWFTSTALKEVEDIKKKNKEVEDWVLVVNLGVNDLGNSNKYIKKYKSLMKKEWKYDYIYFVSVNPIDRSKYKGYVTNDRIQKYNKQLKKLGKSMYIDTYSYLTKNGFSTSDGLHYTKSTNKKIYKYIRKKMNL